MFKNVQLLELLHFLFKALHSELLFCNFLVAKLSHVLYDACVVVMLLSCLHKVVCSRLLLAIFVGKALVLSVLMLFCGDYLSLSAQGFV